MADITPLYTSNSSEWETPQFLFDALNEEFNFNLDAAATNKNSKCDQYFDSETNGLVQDWKGYTVWLNCPYSAVARWMEKAYHEAVAGNATTVMLVASRTDTRYWWNYARQAEVRFLKGRLKFIGGAHSAPFPSAIVIFYKDIVKRNPKTIYWEIKKPK